MYQYVSKSQLWKLEYRFLPAPALWDRVCVCDRQWEVSAGGWSTNSLSRLPVHCFSLQDGNSEYWERKMVDKFTEYYEQET